MGSVSAYSTASGKRYRVRYRKPDHSQTDKRGFTTKKEAELFLATVEIGKATGSYIDPLHARITVEALGQAWLNRQGHLKASTRRTVISAWNNHVQGRWGPVEVRAVRHTDVAEWVTELSLKKGPTTVSRAYGVLASILDGAVRDRRIPSNPARGVDLPRKVRKRRVYLSHEQVELLASQAKDKGPLVRTLAYCGLRWGEVTALRVCDVDVDRRRFNMHENAVNVGGRIIVGSPKNHSARSVPFPAFLLNDLRDVLSRRAPAELLFGDGQTHLRSPDGRDGWYVNALARSRALQAGFPSLTIHDLRHTAASLAISAGANVKAVQRMLGHASAAMTLDTYADLFDDDLDAVATALNHARAKSNVGTTWADGPSLPRKPGEEAQVYGDLRRIE